VNRCVHPARALPVLAALLVTCILALAAAAQERAGPATGRDPKETPGDSSAAKSKNHIRVGVDLVRVPLTVLDPYERLVTGLGRGDFRVFEDGVEQEILHVHEEDAPISVAIVFDKSGSMGVGGAIQAAQLMGVEFLRTANPEDDFMVVSFDGRARLVSGFTGSVEGLKTDLMFTQAKGMTAMNDAIYLALGEMRRARNDRKAIIIITDGGENHSRFSDRDVERAALESSAQFYVIGGSGNFLLGRLADKTGGRIFGWQQHADTAAHIWSELRNQYVLGYRPSNARRDGKWRKIKVQLRVPRGLPKLHVFAKSGYLAPNM